MIEEPCSVLQSAKGGFDCKEFYQFFDSLANPVRHSALADCGECARCCSSIFAVAPESSAVADLMDRIDCGKFVLINNEESILEILRAMLKKEDEYTFSGANEYAWEERGLKYMEVIDEIV